MTAALRTHFELAEGRALGQGEHCPQPEKQQGLCEQGRLWAQREGSVS